MFVAMQYELANARELLFRAYIFELVCFCFFGSDLHLIPLYCRILSHFPAASRPNHCGSYNCTSKLNLSLRMWIIFHCFSVLSLMHWRMNRYSSVGTVTRLPTGAANFSRVPAVCVVCGTCPTPYPDPKRPRPEPDHPPPFNAEVKNTWNCASIS